MSTIPTSNILTVLIQTTTLLVLAHFITTTFLSWHKLRHFPGPRLASFSRLWLFRAAISGKAYQFRMAARKKVDSSSSSPNPLIRIGPDMLMTDDPAIMRRINAAHGGYVRGDWYRVFRLDPHQDSLIASLDNKFHDNIRARVAGGITGRDVPGMEATINEVVASLIRLIENKYLRAPSPTSETTTRPMDWAMVAQFFTLDALTKVAYNKDFGHLERDEDAVGYIRTVEDMGFFFAISSDITWLGWLLSTKLFLRLFGPKPTDSKGPGAIMG